MAVEEGELEVGKLGEFVELDDAVVVEVDLGFATEAGEDGVAVGPFAGGGVVGVGRGEGGKGDIGVGGGVVAAAAFFIEGAGVAAIGE